MFEAHLAAYALAATFIMLVPGPANLLVMSRSASAWREGFSALAGILLANAMLLGAAIAGISAAILHNAMAFLLLKAAGAIYLIYCGVRTMNSRIVVSSTARAASRGATDGFLTGITNPKALVFYVGFLPQFITDSAPACPQLVALGWLDMMLATAVFSVYAFTGNGLLRFFRSDVTCLWFNRCVGIVMIGSGAAIVRTFAHGA